jgi:hypothetical protein
MHITIPHTSLFQYATSVLNIISALAPPPRKLQDSQIEFLAHFASLPEKYRHFPFSLQARRLVKANHYPDLKLRLISARLDNLKRKGYITRKSDGELHFNDHLLSILRSYPKFTLNVTFDQKKDTQNT